MHPVCAEWKSRSQPQRSHLILLNLASYMSLELIPQFSPLPPFRAIAISCQDYTNGSILFSSHSSNPFSGLRPKPTSWNSNVIVLPLPPAPLEIPQWLLSTLLIKMCLPDTSYKVTLMSPAHSFCSSHTACLFLLALSIFSTFTGLLQMLNPPSISSLVDSNLWIGVTSLQGVTCPSCVTLAKKALLIPW